SVISLPLSHAAAEAALALAAQPRAMKRLTGKLDDVRAARIRTTVNDMERTLIVVESKELLEGQKRGSAARLGKAMAELGKLQRLVDGGRIRRASLEQRVKKVLRREHLSEFVMGELGGTEKAPTLTWRVDEQRRKN